MDDDPRLLVAMKRGLRNHPFDVETAGSASEALVVLAGSTFDAIVSDERMPKMSGSELLVEVARRHPRILRITLTGEASVEAAMRAINEARIHSFLTKPIRPSDLASVIEEGLAARTSTGDTAIELDYIDEATGLPNELYFAARIDERIEQCRSGAVRMTVVLMSVDRLRLFEASLESSAFGLTQQIGDRVRGRCAQTMDLLTGSIDLQAPNDRAQKPSDVVVARIGSDEFAVLFVHHGLANASRVVREISASMDAPFELDGQRIYLSSRFGIVNVGTEYDCASQILRDGRVALTLATRNAGLGAIGVFEPTMRSDAQLRVELEADFRTALNLEQLEIFYQPLVDAITGRIIGCEALIRWFHPKHGFIPPPKIIAIAEETELMGKLGQWILETSCRRQVEWREAGSPIKLSVNASPSEVQHPNFVDRILKTVAATGIDPRHLQLEITEGVLIENAEQTMNVIEQLRDAGVHLALDDFGTGYSSLSYLRSLTIDTLKIDKSFVDHVLTNARDAALLECIVYLAKRLDYAVIAEGVETEAQREFLISAGVREIQGYLFSKPLRLDDFERYLVENAR